MMKRLWTRSRTMYCGVLMFGFLLFGCQPEPVYDDWTIDIAYTETRSIVVQTFTNVRPDPRFVEDERERQRYQKWFCNDQSDTFKREWKTYADQLGMQSLEFRSIEVESANPDGCNVSIQGSKKGWTAPATVFTELLESDSYVIKRRGQNFRLDIDPSAVPEKFAWEVNLWLSERFPGRLIEANTAVFDSNPSEIRIGFHQFWPSEREASPKWRRARWDSKTLRRDGIQFAFAGPILHGEQNPTGLDNRPTRFPGRQEQ